jgi:hypothetical protein
MNQTDDEILTLDAVAVYLKAGKENRLFAILIPSAGTSFSYPRSRTRTRLTLRGGHPPGAIRLGAIGVPLSCGGSPDDLWQGFDDLRASDRLRVFFSICGIPNEITDATPDIRQAE